MIQFSYSTRVKLGICLIAFLTLAPDIRDLMHTLFSFRTLPNIDDISQYERRFAEVRQYLPRGEIVTYQDEFASIPGECNAFMLARYSVAPTILEALNSRCGHSTVREYVPTPHSQFVLENFHDPESEPYLRDLFPAAYFQPHDASLSNNDAEKTSPGHLVLVKDFGHGVRLFERVDP